MFKDAIWMGVPVSELEKWNILQGDINGRFAYFRCEIILEETASLNLTITANSRYRLWINNKPVLSGPCKGDRYRHYFETLDVSEFLNWGKNVFAVQVLASDAYSVFNQQEDERLPLIAIASVPSGHRLAVEGSFVNEKKEVVASLTSGTAPWKVYLDGSFYLKSKEITINLGAICEDIDFNSLPESWKCQDYIDDNWVAPILIEPTSTPRFNQLVGLLEKYPLTEREIPLLYEEEVDFLCDIYGSDICKEEYVTVDKGKDKVFILDAGEIKNGYMKYRFSGGGSLSKIKFTYFEKFMGEESNRKRTDYVDAFIQGLEDEIVLSGNDLTYEPFWFRTFRFIRIEVTAGEVPLRIYRPRFMETGYPLEIQTAVDSSEGWVKSLWEICVRTLKRCMTETYMDCPFYEQMQFPMDTRLQALFTYTVSGDTRLIKKALKDFHHSMIPDGLIQGKYPSSFTQIISTFSLHYIYMLYDYYMQTGDVDTIKRYRTDVDAILSYYERKIGKHQLVENLGYWEFVDWQTEWSIEMGAPTASLFGPSTIINLMYGYALLCGAYLNEQTGRRETGEEYRLRQKELIKQIQRLCWSEEVGLYREGPNMEQYSQHAQAWAVLNEMIPEEKGREILKKSLDYDNIIKCSFSTSYEFFGALEKVGLYKETNELLKLWINLISLDCTTCPEEPVNGRSECHAWSALPIYELIRNIAGIRMGEIAWGSVEVNPHMEYLQDIKGTAVTPYGQVTFDYRRTDFGITYELCLPKELSGILKLPNGEKENLVQGENSIIYNEHSV